MGIIGNKSWERKLVPVQEQSPFKRKLLVWVIIVIFGLSVVKLWHNQYVRVQHPSYQEFYNELKNDKVRYAVLVGNRLKGGYFQDYRDGKHFALDIPKEDLTIYQILREHVKDFRIKQTDYIISNILISLIPILVLVGLLWFVILLQIRGLGRSSVGFARNRAKLLTRDREIITFNDIAGVDEAKEELEEIVEFLKDPTKFEKLGGRIPKGVLLMGLPGTGKTLLAKAIAGEANVPFLSISGSDFVEMFVGVGASRVRDLFRQAKKHPPCIIFLDEIDAIGRSRSLGMDNAYIEREQTLNALLVEMDGFNTKAGVIVIAATNRPDVLDPALLRPGRFDRQVILDLPDLYGRVGILKVHTRRIPLAENVKIEKIAMGTSGFSGADLANLVNESALLAAKRNKPDVGMSEFEESRDKVKWGKERKSRGKYMDENERRMNAYHEAGHALVLHLIPEAEPLHKVTIIPRGIAFLGATMQLPQKDRYTQTKKQLLAEITGLMAGRVAEEIVFGDVSTGSNCDISYATKLARLMVCQWGMSEKIGPVRLGEFDESIFLKKETFRRTECSEATAQNIDEETSKIISDCCKRGYDIINSNKNALIEIADNLLAKEVLEGHEIADIVAKKVTKKSPKSDMGDA